MADTEAVAALEIEDENLDPFDEGDSSPREKDVRVEGRPEEELQRYDALGAKDRSVRLPMEAATAAIPLARQQGTRDGRLSWQRARSAADHARSQEGLGKLSYAYHPRGGTEGGG